KVRRASPACGRFLRRAQRRTSRHPCAQSTAGFASSADARYPSRVQGYGQGGQGGYGPPGGYTPRPPSSGPSIVAIIVGCAIGGFVLLFIAGAVVGFMRVKGKKEKVDPEKVVLSERYATTNGFIVAHYPSDFAAKRIDNATVLVSRSLGIGDEFL